MGKITIVLEGDKKELEDIIYNLRDILQKEE